MLFWYICFGISAALLVAGLLTSIHILRHPGKQKKKMLLKASTVLAVGIALAGLFIVLPITYDRFAHVGNVLSRGFQALLLSIHSTIRLFVVDGDFADILTGTLALPHLFRVTYSILALILFVLAPVMTFSVALSFFANMSSRWRYRFAWCRDAYIFSEINDKALALARDLKRIDPKATLVFTDVFERNDEESHEQIEQAKMLGSILFKDDVTVVNLHRLSTRPRIYFFLIGEDEAENINQALLLASPPTKEKGKLGGYDCPRGPQNGFARACLAVLRFLVGKRKQVTDINATRIYLFSTNENSELQLSTLKPNYMRVRRINDVQSLVFRELYDHGDVLFRGRALKDGETSVGSLYEQSVLPSIPVCHAVTGKMEDGKHISAVIVGMGLHGSEMVKSLCWFCQMPHYRLDIHAYDLAPDADARFRASCPELMQEGEAVDGVYPDKMDLRADPRRKQYNGDHTTVGEAHYSITVHGGIDVGSFDFEKELYKLDCVTYVLVALGNDDLNIRTATKIRMILRRRGLEPYIQVIVYDPRKQEVLGDRITNFAHVSYDLHLIGDLASNYSVPCILSPQLEAEALERHLSYTRLYFKDTDTDEDRARQIEEATRDFYAYDYNYRSSTASVIHRKYKILCGVSGADLLKDDRTEEQAVLIRHLEHQRWNAFVRSDGFVLPEVGRGRDKLAKTHHCLVPFRALPYEEQIKDDD